MPLINNTPVPHLRTAVAKQLRIEIRSFRNDIRNQFSTIRSVSQLIRNVRNVRKWFVEISGNFEHVQNFRSFRKWLMTF